MDGEHQENDIANEGEGQEYQEKPQNEGEGQDDGFDIEEVEMSDITGPEVK